MYEEAILQGINQAIDDELTSATLYYNMSEFLVGVDFEEVREEMVAHGDEEISHFKELLGYAHNHGMKPIIGLNIVVANEMPCDFVGATSLIQTLEIKAINLYESLAKLANDNGDIETYHFFKELMEKEMEHFDDIAKLTGQSRSLARFDKIKDITAMSFGDFVNTTYKPAYVADMEDEIEDM